jgi:hypothetical protein
MFRSPFPDGDAWSGVLQKGSLQADKRLFPGRTYLPPFYRRIPLTTVHLFLYANP